MTRSNLQKVKVEVMLKRQGDSEFPEFLRNLRLLLGFTRKVVAADLGLQIARLIDLEKGYFSKMPDEEVINMITDYYDLPPGFLNLKAVEYVAKKDAEKSKKKYRSVIESYPDIPLHLLNSSVPSANHLKV
jgi:transcriptional regulator with XRE-family HTH domain